MSRKNQTGQAPFVFTYCDDLRGLPEPALPLEEKLHGGFAVDKRPGFGQIYYGMPGLGLLRIGADLARQELIELPADLTPVNFHSTKIGEFDGKTRLFLAANANEMVVVASLIGDIEFVLPRPEFDHYLAAETLFKPTDTVLDGHRLVVADGYGANYISTADLSTRQWRASFGGKTDNREEHGRFGTAHGMSRTPDGQLLAIADRPHSRLELSTFDGVPAGSFSLPAGSKPCGIDFTEWGGRAYAVVGSLDDPTPGRSAPIYVLDGQTYEVLSTLRPKEDLGIERADHIHNVVWHQHNGQLFLVCQSWKPGFFFVLAKVDTQ
ncbi:MAG: hypothetical protein ABIQ99_03290 [Thermoflexales bacterium]